jgi:hypothetical protein
MKNGGRARCEWGGPASRVSALEPSTGNDDKPVDRRDHPFMAFARADSYDLSCGDAKSRFAQTVDHWVNRDTLHDRDPPATLEPKLHPRNDGTYLLYGDQQRRHSRPKQ